MAVTLPTEAEAMAFPSIEQYQKLKQKISSSSLDSLSEKEKTLNRNYNYAWQQVVRQNPWPTEDDPRYNPEMHWQAAEMFRRWRKPKVPDLPEPKMHSDEEIAHVVACNKLIKLYFEHGERRRQAAVRGRPVPAPLDLIPTDRLTAAEIEVQTEALIVAAGLRG